MNDLGVYLPENFYAGTFPVEKEVMTVAAGETVKKFAPVKLVAGAVEPIAAEDDIPDVYGIALEDGEDGAEIVGVLTGEYFGTALALEDGITVELIKPALRNIGIFIKEGQE